MLQSKYIIYMFNTLTSSWVLSLCQVPHFQAQFHFPFTFFPSTERSVTISFFWDMTLHHWITASWHFEAMWCPHLLGLFIIILLAITTHLRVLASSVLRFRDHTQGSSGRAISWSQRPLPGKHTTLTPDKHPCPRRDSKPQSQQASGCRPSP
jgi:hypothetical protein